MAARPGMTGGVAGLLLAAGAGRRMGMPKALVQDGGGSWLVRGVELLRDAGCDPVVPVLGAEAERAAGLLPAWASPVVAADWATGMGASLARGIESLRSGEAVAVLVTLVDLPSLPLGVLHRVLAAGAGADSLARAVFDGAPGHPVLIGRSHWQPLADTLDGDVGARDYLRAHGARLIECGDLGGGADRDAP